MPDDGLAQFIAISELLIVLGGLLLAVLLSRILARKLGWSGAKLFLATLALGVIGFGGGVLGVIATFYENTWAPPPVVTFNVPPDFNQNWVILLEDRSIPVQLVWAGGKIPFFGKKTLIDVPSSGIVRVRDLSGLYSALVRARWNDRSYSSHFAGGGPAPKSSGATSYVAFSRDPPDAEPDPDEYEREPFHDEAAFAAYIAARERGAL
jgi:hypothetical protein